MKSYQDNNLQMRQSDLENSQSDSEDLLDQSSEEDLINILTDKEDDYSDDDEYFGEENVTQTPSIVNTSIYSKDMSEEYFTTPNNQIGRRFIGNIFKKTQDLVNEA